LDIRFALLAEKREVWGAPIALPSGGAEAMLLAPLSFVRRVSRANIASLRITPEEPNVPQTLSGIKSGFDDFWSEPRAPTALSTESVLCLENLRHPWFCLTKLDRLLKAPVMYHYHCTPLHSLISFFFFSPSAAVPLAPLALQRCHSRDYT
jgi:hypothetical protein